MGLDIAGYVMDIEAEFQIDIPSNINLKTVGALYDFIMAELLKQGEPIRDKVWDKLVLITKKHTKYPVNRNSNFCEDLGLN